MKLIPTEEQTVIQHVLDLDVQGFLPQLAAVKNMADSLLAEYYQDPVGHNWAANFVKRWPEFKVKFNQKYDYKKALCKDPKAIRVWFQLVEHTKAKYCIQDEETYSFDKSGFMMGIDCINRSSCYRLRPSRTAKDCPAGQLRVGHGHPGHIRWCWYTTELLSLK
jgi:hypothetical protein